MGRPWWYDSYWEKDKKPKTGFQLPKRPLWLWITVVVLALLLTAFSRGFHLSAIPWLLDFVYFLSRILIFIIFLRVILSWFTINRYNLLIVLLDGVSEPILSPLRRIVPRLGMLDFTPMVTIAILYVIPLLFNWLLS